MASLTPLVWMGALCGGSAAVAIASGAPAAEVLWGMAGPLAAASVTWVLVHRAFQASPERVTGVMVKAFAGKMLFFGAYVVTMLGGLTLSLRPFSLSFTAFFIGVYAIEALFMQRLFASAR